jgi:hypothetical protein
MTSAVNALKHTGALWALHDGRVSGHHHDDMRPPAAQDLTGSSRHAARRKDTKLSSQEYQLLTMLSREYCCPLIPALSARERMTSSRIGYNAWRCVEAGPVLLVWGDDAKLHIGARRRKWSSSGLKKARACL